MVPLCLVFCPPFCSASAAPACSADAVHPWVMRPAAMDVCFWKENTAWLDDNATAEDKKPVAERLEDDGGGGRVVVSSAAVDDDGDPSRRVAASRQRITYISEVLVAEPLLLLEPVEEGYMISTLNAYWNLMGHFYSVLAGGLSFAMLSIRVWRWIRNLKRSAWTSRARKEVWGATRDYYRSWATVTSKAVRFLAEDWRDWGAQPVTLWATRPPPARARVAVRLRSKVRWWLWMVWLGVNTLASDLRKELCGKATTATAATTQPPGVAQPMPKPAPGVTQPAPRPYAAEDWHAWRVYPVRARPVRQQRPAIQDGIGAWTRRVWSDVRWWIWFVWFGISTFWCELRTELRRAELDDDSNEEEVQPTTASATRRHMAASATRLPKGAKAARRKVMKPRPW